MAQSQSIALPEQYCQIVLNERPGLGPIKPTTFKKVDKSSAELRKAMKETDVLLQVDYCSLDPTMRSWINETRSYIEPVQLGAVMRGNSLSTVVAVGEKVQNVKLGDLVTSMSGMCCIR
jgi:NADPH-dependent curcumin reductase CurA